MTSADLMAAEKLIKDNFLSLQLVSGRQMMVEFNDNPKMTSVNFIGQLGGALNLWAGITVVVIVELIEFVIDICANRRKGVGNVDVK